MVGGRTGRHHLPGLREIVLLGRAVLVAVTSAALLGGCGGTPYAPVDERGAAARITPDFRVVRRGDTLYSIAWDTGVDYLDLARWNGIRPPYVIHPGDHLWLKPRTPARPARPVPATPSAPAVGKSAPPAATVRSAPAKPAAPLPRFSGWAWPAKGPVIRSYSAERGSKGVDIGGGRGQPVYAAGSGRVVYQGSGLRGYGRLIIIKHNETFLSAYAHNEKILVNEGEAVKRGQAIATMGDSGTDRVKLHFEIRRHGKPVNPLHYLPKTRS
jgi:lipoprotein NlpD